MITSRIAKAVTKSNAGTFIHLVLSNTEHVEGCKLGINSWAYTCCAGKHTFVEEFIEGITVTSTGFTLATGRYDLLGRSPYKVVMHYTRDILEYVCYTWFQWCWYFGKSTNSK